MTRIERLKLLASAIAGDFKSLRLKLGNTDELVTDNKTSAVNAINEVAGSSKEIKDAMKNFSENLGFDKDIVKTNGISVNPFEMLVPFIKDKLAEENIIDTDAEKQSENYFIVYNDGTIKINQSNISKNKFGFKLKQGAFNKFINYDITGNGNDKSVIINIPAEINTTQKFELSMYGILGHYMQDYQIMPYTDYIKQLNVSQDNLIFVNSLEEHKNNSYFSGINDKLLFVKINDDELDGVGIDKINALFRINNVHNLTTYSFAFINERKDKYFDFTIRQWLPITDLITSDMRLQLEMLALKVPVENFNIKYVNNTNLRRSSLNILNIMAETSEAIETINNNKYNSYEKSIILNPELTKYYNKTTKQWVELDNNLRNKFSYLNNGNYVNQNINDAIAQDSPYIINGINITTLESDSNSREILIVDKDKITNLAEVESSSLYNVSTTTSLVVDKTLDYVLNKNTRTWTKISSEQSAKIKEKITPNFDLVINDEMDNQSFRCRANANGFVIDAPHKKVYIYDKNNTNLDLSTITYDVFDPDFVIDKTFTYYLNPYNSTWYELPTTTKNKLANIINKNYEAVVESLKKQLSNNYSVIVETEETLNDVHYDNIYLIKNKEQIAFQSTDNKYQFMHRTLILTSDLNEYLDILTREWKQVQSNNIINGIIEYIVGKFANDVINKYHLKDDVVTLTTQSLDEIKNLVKNKESIKNESNQQLVSNNTIDLSNIKFYSLSKNEQGINAQTLLEKMPNIKMVNSVNGYFKVNELPKNKTKDIIFVTTGGYNKKTMNVYYNGKYYEISANNFFYKNNHDMFQFLSYNDFL